MPSGRTGGKYEIILSQTCSFKRNISHKYCELFRGGGGAMTRPLMVFFMPYHWDFGHKSYRKFRAEIMEISVLDFIKDCFRDMNRFKQAGEYNLMQSDLNSFCGDVVFDSVIIASGIMTAFWTKYKKFNLHTKNPNIFGTKRRHYP